MMTFLAISGIASGIIATAFGLFVLLKNPRGIINRSYALLSLCIAIWGYAYFFIPLSQNSLPRVLLSFRILQIGAILIGPSFLFFIFALLNLHREKKKLIIWSFIIAGLLIVSDFTPLFIKSMSPKLFFRYWANPGIAYHLYLLFWSWCVLYPWYLIIRNYRALSEFKQNQIKYVFLASVIGFLGGATNYPLWYNIPLPPVGTILVGLHVLLLAYAIVKYRLMDISVTITRAGIFLTVYTLVLGLPFFFATTGKSVFVDRLGAYWWLGPLVLMAALGATGPFVYLFLKNKAEAIILREQRLYQKTLKLAAVDLTRIRNPQRIFDFIAVTITESVKISFTSIYSFDPRIKEFSLRSYVPRKNSYTEIIDSDNLLIEWLIERGESIVLEEVRREADMDKHEGSAEIIAEMEKLRAAVIVPCFLKDKLLNIIILGEKLSGKLYTQDDIDNFTVLADAVALAGENAMLYEKIENEVRQKTDELIAMQKQLVHAEKLATVGTLAGGVAHEINNPLAAILTNVQMLLSGDELDKESLQMIEEATKRCKTIVQKLMTFAKKPIENTVMSEIDLLETIKRSIDFIKFQLEQENISVSVSAENNAYPVLGNRDEIGQVLTNIILNAKDAIRQVKKQGTVEILITEEPEWFRITIKDEGPGIPKEIISRIFDPFFTTKDVGQGLGLGLSISHSIIEKHNGKIHVESEPNKGSRFSVLLPKLKKTSA